MAQDSALAEEPVRDGLEGAGRYGPGLPWPGVGGGTGATEDWGFKTLALKPGSASPASASLFPLPPGAQDRHQLRKDRVSSISQGSARLRVQSAGKNHGDGAQMLIFSSGSSVVSGSDGENRSSRSRDGGMMTRPGSSFSSEAGGGRSGLIESRNARVQTEHHYQLLKARVAKLAFEEERANKTALLCKARAQDVLRLRQDVERRQQQRQQMREQQQSQESLDAKRRAELQQERRAARRLQSKGIIMSRQECARDMKAQRKRNEEIARRNSEEAVRKARLTRQELVDGVADSMRSKAMHLAQQKQQQADIIYKDKMLREETERLRLAREIEKMQEMEAAMLARVNQAQAKQCDALLILQQSLV